MVVTTVPEPTDPGELPGATVLLSPECGTYGGKRSACQWPTVRYWMAAWAIVFCAVNFRIA